MCVSLILEKVKIEFYEGPKCFRTGMLKEL